MVLAVPPHSVDGQPVVETEAQQHRTDVMRQWVCGSVFLILASIPLIADRWAASTSPKAQTVPRAMFDDLQLRYEKLQQMYDEQGKQLDRAQFELLMPELDLPGESEEQPPRSPEFLPYPSVYL